MKDGSSSQLIVQGQWVFLRIRKMNYNLDRRGRTVRRSEGYIEEHCPDLRVNKVVLM